MKKLICIILMVLLLFGTLTACRKTTPVVTPEPSPSPTLAPTVAPTPVEVAPRGDLDLSGAINGKLDVHMKLKVDGNEINGSYYYDKIKKEITLNGTLVEGRYFSLEERSKASDRVTGTFEGVFVSATRMEGVWYNASNRYPFWLSINSDAKAEPVADTAGTAKWQGEWKRVNSGIHASSTLSVYFATDNSFWFSMETFSGAHTGGVSGTALRTGNKAVFKGENGSVFEFELSGDTLDMKVNEAADSFYAGMGVTFAGTYKKGPLNELEPTLTSMGIVGNTAQEDAFKSITGDDWKKFIDTAQFSNEEADLDGFGALVHSFRVLGLAGDMESIVMIRAKDNKIWAALIDDGKVKYYTNDPSGKPLPKTIEKWRESFSDLEVVYMN